MNSPHHDAALYFKELVEKDSKGRLKINIYPNQELGTDPEMVELTRQGKLAFTVPPTSKIASLAPELELLDLPYLFTDRSTLYQSLDHDFGKELTKELESFDLQPLYFWESGFKNFTANKPLTDPNDFIGLRFRVMASDILAQQAISLNAFPMHVDFHQVKTQLELGKIDCQENPLSSIYLTGIYKAQKYLMLSKHGFLGQLLLASTKILIALPPDLQNIIKKASYDASLYQRERALYYEDLHLKKLKEQNINMVSYDYVAIEKLIQAFKPLYFSYRHRLNRFKEIVNPAITRDTDHLLGIGLNLSFNYTAYTSALAIRMGAQIAIDEINAKGGIQGKRLVLLTYSHDGFPHKGKENIKRFAADEKIIALLGGMHSPVILSERETINELKIPYLIPWAAATAIISPDNPYTFRFSIRDADVGANLISKASKYGQQASLLLEKTSWGDSNLEAIRMAATKPGSFKIGQVLRFDWGQSSFKDILQKIYSSRDDVIIYVGNAPEASQLIGELSRKKHQIPLVSHWGITGGRFWHNSRELLTKTPLSFVTSFPLDYVQKNKNGLDFLNRFSERFNQKSSYFPAFFATIHSYELLRLLGKAMEKSTDLSRNNIRDELEAIQSFEGLFKNYIKPFAQKSREHEVLKDSDIFFGRYDEVGNIVHDQ